MKYLQIVSRSLIALLFVVAGVQKIMNLSGTTGYVGSLGVPMATLATILVIIIEVPVALLFAYGWRKCLTGSILIIFTILTIVLVHMNWSVGDNMIMALKNIAIIGGILAIVGNCDCKDCVKCRAKACGCGVCADCKANKN